MNNRYVHIYMDKNTYQDFCSKCPDDLFGQLTISNIKYSPKRHHDKFRYYYPFMISTHINNTDLLYDVMKQIDLWKQKIRWNYLPPEKVLPQKSKKISEILKSLKKYKQELSHPISPVAPSEPVTDKTTPAAVPTPKLYEITDLTPQMVEQLLNMPWNLINNILYGPHFYHAHQYNNNLTVKMWQKELNTIEDTINQNPIYDGRKLAFITYIPTVYTCAPYTHTPRHASQIDEDDDPFDTESMTYSTFISYNPKTRQFEKYPRGWIRIKANASIYTIQQHICDNITDILSAFTTDKQNTR